jgi:hypothetical protein
MSTGQPPTGLREEPLGRGAEDHAASGHAGSLFRGTPGPSQHIPRVSTEERMTKIVHPHAVNTSVWAGATHPQRITDHDSHRIDDHENSTGRANPGMFDNDDNDHGSTEMIPSDSDSQHMEPDDDTEHTSSKISFDLCTDAE